MASRSTSPAAGKSAFQNVLSRIEAPATAHTSPKVHTHEHHESVEPLTQAITEDFGAAQASFGRLLRRAKQLAEHDTTHGQRLYDAAKNMRTAFAELERRVAEMQEHVDEDTP